MDPVNRSAPGAALTLEPRDFVFGRLLMLAFLLIFLERQSRALHLVLTGATATAEPQYLLLALVLVLGISLVYAWFWLRVAGGRRDWAALLAVATLLLLVTIYVLIGGDAYTFYYPAIVAGTAFNWRQSLGAVALVMAALLGTHLVLEGNLDAGANPAVVVLLLGTAAIAVRRHIATHRRLEAARDEIHRLATRSERLRFARDLHDELGQTLSLIVVKSELAAQEASGPARQRIEEVTTTTRQALTSLRDLVSNFRQPTLAEELNSARSLLEASGIECAIEVRVQDINPTVEATLAWAVREAATNILRHSGGHHCSFTIEARGKDVRVEVNDDGRDTGPFQAGNGLRGLEERVAFLGGRLISGRQLDQGFRLLIEVPVT